MKNLKKLVSTKDNMTQCQRGKKTKLVSTEDNMVPNHFLYSKQKYVYFVFSISYTDVVKK